MWSEWNDAFLQQALFLSLRALLIAAGVGGLLAAARVPRGAVRHAAWTAVVAAMLLMPALVRLAPQIDLSAIPVARSAPPMSALPVEDQAPAAPSSVASSTGSVSGGASARPLTSRAPALGPTWPPSPRAESIWPVIVVGIYAAGVVFFIARLSMGLWRVRRLVHASRPAGRPGSADSWTRIRESSSVAVPLAVGVFRPQVVLPATWHLWPEEQLRAVLAHELTHVRRHDPLVAVLTFLNRALFWFNPLAWWLEKAIASNAEDACDAVAVREVDTPRTYAGLLVEMADAVRRHGARVSWQGIGVDGTGLLGPRIDRILRGDFAREVSVARKIGIAVGCILTIGIVVACRQAKPAVLPLEPDPQLMAQWAQEKARSATFAEATGMTVTQVAALERALEKNPDDRETRSRLLTFYFSGDFEHKVVSWEEKVATRRRHLLFAIAHDPGGPLFEGWRRISPIHDPDGYAQAKKLWLATLARKDVALPVLRNAACFFQAADRPLTEQILLRAQAMDPGGPTPLVKDGVYYQAWSGWLGSLYAGAIMAAMPGAIEDPTATAVVTDADRAFATKARSLLESTSDATMLAGAGSTLGRSSLNRTNRFLDATDPAVSELEPLGATYLNRALTADPGLTSARGALAWLASWQRSRRLLTALNGVPKEKLDAVIQALPEAERLYAWTFRAERLRGEAGTMERKNQDPAGARALWTLSKKYADDVLTLVESRSTDPYRGMAMHSAHITLATIALHDNDLASALVHMDAAANVPPSDDLKFGSLWNWQEPAVELLKRGEREPVARFLSRLAAIAERDRESFTTAAAQIRSGKMPAFFQYQTVAH